MAYASVISLMQNLEEILHSDPYVIYLNKELIVSLHKSVGFLKLFLENSGQGGEYDQTVVRKLVIRVTVAAQKAQDFVESHVYINNARPACLAERDFGWKQVSLIAHQSFTKVVEEVESTKLEVEQLCENELRDGKIMPAGISSSSQDLMQSPPNAEDKLVGVDADIDKLLHQLSGPALRLQVIPIVGMGGIGKTTLARRIYDDPFVVEYFYIRSWITVPPGHTVPLAYRVRDMFLGLLKCFTNITHDVHKLTNEELGEKLYKSLKGMRYLVVLDDMWQTVDWNVLKRFCPDDENGSRIILTSRLRDVYACVDPTCSPHCMHLLKPAESWELLESKLFPGESCPKQLINIGKRIVAKCQGLPLAIVVVAGILNKMDETLESWTKIAEGVESIVAKDPERCINILSLSYYYLPEYLKACFLYMGAFPKDYEIPVSRLIWLWIAEGFVLPVNGRCLEDVADDYLEDLVNRNLVLVGKKRSDGRIKTCHVHDLLRELCLREAQRENFLHIIKQNTPTFLVKAIAPRRISFHANILHYSSICSKPLTRTFLFYDMHKHLPDMFLLEVIDKIDFKLLRVLDIELLQSNHFPVEIVELIHLRYLALAVNCELPGSICKLQNLQTLIIGHVWEGLHLPREVWKMPRLRHIRLKSGCYLPLPYTRDTSVLRDLQTLSTLIGPVSCSKEVFVRLPGLRKLEIIATESGSQSSWISKCLSNLGCLSQLEALKCCFLYRPRKHRLPTSGDFPANLKKLTLTGSYLPWEDAATLAGLPNLEVLKLASFAFEGDVWRPDAGGFLKLKILLLENTDPMDWEADSAHFPVLQQLIVRECHRLREIPKGIGDIPTLQMIEVHDSSFCVVCSARAIHEQQQMLGNDELVVRIASGNNYSPV